MTFGESNLNIGKMHLNLAEIEFDLKKRGYKANKTKDNYIQS